MAKFFGVVGYAETRETSPGIWEEVITDRMYKGDVISVSTRRAAQNESSNDDISVNAQISILADQFAYQNSQYIKYVEFMGAKWCVSNITPQHPRLILTLGGVYNGQ